ncbi:hypothetical protein Tco_0007866 [Tanacetum coccineum]
MPESSQQLIKIEKNLFLLWRPVHIPSSSNDVEYVEASPPNSEPVSSKVMEIVIPEVGRIEDDILLIKDDTLREKLLNVNRLVAKIKALKDNPVPSSVVVTKSTSTFPNLFLEETNTFDILCPTKLSALFEESSGSPTTHSELSLPDYKAFYIDNDHFKEKSSGSTTTHVDFSQYDSFIFDLSNDQFPPADRSDFYHEEFADGLAHIISPPEYDRFCFKIEPELGNLTMMLCGKYFPKKRTKSSSGYQQKGRKPSQNDKTEHGMEKTVQNQGQSPKMPKSESILMNQQSNRSRN